MAFKVVISTFKVCKKTHFALILLAIIRHEVDLRNVIKFDYGDPSSWNSTSWQKPCIFMFAKPMNFQPKNKIAFEGVIRGKSC